jgi:hypothetical protein
MGDTLDRISKGMTKATSRGLVLISVLAAVLLAAAPASASLPGSLGFKTLAASDAFNEQQCGFGLCSGELGVHWDAKSAPSFAGWTNVALTGSQLELRAVWDGSWAGAWLEGLNLGHFKTPYFATVRARAPGVYGMWPSPGVTWSYPYGENCGTEVDFAELLGRSPRGVPQTVQGCNSNGGDVGITKSSPISTSITKWHTYAAAVYSNRVVFYIDGHKSQVTYNSAVPGSVNRSTYSDLNTNFNIGGCPTSWPGCPTTHTTQHLYVDWIRAYIK